MKKSRWSLLLAVTVVMFYSLTTTVFADTNITAQHQLVSQAEGANGFDISLSFTIQNSGLESLSNVNLEITDPTVTAEPGTNKLYLVSLPSGAQLEIDWNIIAVTPLLGAERPLLILGNGTKGNGQSMVFHLISMGVNQ